MITRSLGPDAPLVAAVGLGGMPLSLKGRPSQDTAVAVVHASLDAGVTLIDTADVYCIDDSDVGHNERLVARSLASWTGSRDAVIVATKGGLTRPGGRWERNGHPKHLRSACDRSLKALGIDCIQLYQLHAPDPNALRGQCRSRGRSEAGRQDTVGRVIQRDRSRDRTGCVHSARHDGPESLEPVL
jgi:aryl-alcohol dehydrogenase-like predicted oxidoreductase